MSIANTYPVFEADQVLTNNHLNGLFNYLDQQDRLTRSKLIGSGIVCGLEITHTDGNITITKGCAVTSQGFMVPFCETVFTNYVPYTPPELPSHLQYIRQCGTDEESKEIITYYKNLFNAPGFQLIKQEQITEFSGHVIQPLSQADLSEYIVVLYLEAEELNLKNCDTNDCNDKGSRMDFDLKALLIPRETIDKILKEQKAKQPDSAPPWPALKRYNVPVQNLSTASAVMAAFRNMTDDTTIDNIAAALKYCAGQYNFLLANEPSTVFDTAATTLKTRRHEIIKNNPLLFQYFYDHLDDIIKAYREFIGKARLINIECCMNEMLFPLHIMLGEADKDTLNAAYTPYRQHFIYSPLFNTGKGRLNETRSLFTRLRLLIDEFNIKNIELTNKKQPVIKITPGRYGKTYLSGRCIPYYYNVDDKSLLHYYWDFDKTAMGHEKLNMSYNAADYSAPFYITNSLLFDIEPFNFFRVEGHIGQHVNEALTEVKQLQQENNLPFEITALSADYIGALLKGEEPQCVIQDLESNYRILIAEFICMLHDVFCKVGQIKYDPATPFKPATRGASAVSMTSPPASIAMTINPAIVAGTFASVLTKEEDDEENKILDSLPVFQAEEFERPFIATIITEAHFLKSYQKGQTLSKLCKPGKNTVGSAYLGLIGNTRFQFSNPVAVNRSLLGTFLINGFFELIDRVESLFELLMNNELAELDIVKFKGAYDHYETTVKSLSDRLLRLRINPLVFLNTCFVEKLEALQKEYVRRTAQYRLAKSFSYYFSRHGGIEHKAGVPRGGTFILVYHEERKNRIPIRDFVFANKDIAAVIVKQIPELLEKTTSKNELESKTKDLHNALQAKDAELSLRLVKLADQFTEDCDDMTAAQKKNLKAMVRPPLSDADLKIADGTVIADFYIPYLCCSDCPPITYILPAKTITPSIAIDKKEFCNDDPDPYEIRVQPAGGNLTLGSTEILADDSGAFIFKPKDKTPGDYKLVYKIEEQSATATITVKKIPDIRFKANAPKASYSDAEEVTVAIIGSPADADNKFDFGDGVIVSTRDKTAKHMYSLRVGVESKTVTIKVTVRDGPCTAEIKTDVKIFRNIIT